MCFTIEVHLTRKAIENRFSVDTSALYDFDFRYFYKAFSNPQIPVITQHDPHAVQLMQWGLIPAWAADWKKAEQIRKGTYNARSESLHEKPSFREPMRNGRCLVIAHGFFEWQQVNGMKRPWYIRLKNNLPFAFAGLFDQWRDPDRGDALQTFSIITAAANPLLAEIHNTKQRMPVILPSEYEREWISGDMSLHKAKQLLVPVDQEELHAHTVAPIISKREADPGNPDIIKPHNYSQPDTLF